MKKAFFLMIRVSILFIIAVLALPAGLRAQDTNPDASGFAAGEAEDAGFSKEELAQMLAPIALYPDSLISQILMASTYPLEIIEAERWLRQNSDLKGDELDAALQEKDWDASVDALCHFPDILFSLSEKIDQTRKLGDAFLAQQDDVMDMIQELRRKADEQGTLDSMTQEKVTRQDTIITIEPAAPDVVYVPVYDPLCVYGPWWYPAYSPWYWWYPSRYIYAGSCFGYGPAFYFGIDFFWWSRFDWRHHRLHIDRDRARHFHNFRGRHDRDRNFWTHNPVHRRGVAYRNRHTSTRFTPSAQGRFRPTPESRGFRTRDIDRGLATPQREGATVPRREERGTDRVRPEPQRGGGATVTTIPRREVPRREITMPEPQRGGGASVTTPPRREVPRREITTPETSRSRGFERPAPRRESPFTGVGSGNFERRSSERGSWSRGESRSAPQRGGGGQQMRQSPAPAPAPHVAPAPRGDGGGHRGSRSDGGGRGGKGGRR